MTSSWGRRLIASLSAASLSPRSPSSPAIVRAPRRPTSSTRPRSAARRRTWHTTRWSALVLALRRGAARRLDRRWIAVLTGIVVALVGTTLGTLVLFSVLERRRSSRRRGVSCSPSLIGINLPFWLAVAIAFPTAGYAVYRAVDGDGRGTGHQGRAGAHPGREPVRGPHHAHRPRDGGRGARRQAVGRLRGGALRRPAGRPSRWRAPTASPTRSSSRTRRSSSATLAVITLPGAESRRPETAGTEAALRAQGLRIERIEAPGTLDGGDVLKVGSTVYVGRGGRTNAEGIRQLRALARAARLRRGGRAGDQGAAPEDGRHRAAGRHRDRLRAARRRPAVFERFLAVPEAHGTAVVVLSDDTVLMSSSAPAVRGAGGGSRLHRHPGRHLGVREARGLRHLPVDPHPLTRIRCSLRRSGRIRSCAQPVSGNSL